MQVGKEQSMEKPLHFPAQLYLLLTLQKANTALYTAGLSEGKSWFSLYGAASPLWEQKPHSHKQHIHSPAPLSAVLRSCG